MTFADLQLHPSLLTALPSPIQTPSRIQQLVIPAVLAGRDLLALAQTGSGKTFAFGLPALQCIERDNTGVQVLILVPTRELAAQVSADLNCVAQRMGIKVLPLCGGVDQAEQIAGLALNPQLVVATPGRLLDLLDQNALSLDGVHQLVLDEADRLLEMGFWPDIQRLSHFMPSHCQTMLFSATLPKQLEAKAMALLNCSEWENAAADGSSLAANSVRGQGRAAPLRIEAQALNSVVAEVDEKLYLVNKGSKAQALIALLKKNSWQQVLVFINARDDANALAKRLAKAGIEVAALHGEKEQQVREQTLADFKARKVRVLVATDLLARGIHVDALPTVINLDLPAHAQTYVHRVGRTARAGHHGVAISLVCHGESEALAAIRHLTGRALTLVELNGFPVTDNPASSESKRPSRDKKANRRSINKRSVKQFKSKSNP